MIRLCFHIVFILACFSEPFAKAQFTGSTAESTGKKGLENVIVETYFVHGKKTNAVVNGVVAKGSVTYRIFIDMAPGYQLNAFYGVGGHLLFYETTTKFYNDYERGARSGKLIADSLLNYPTVAFDSWLTLGAASVSYVGIMKEEDFDGSFVKIPGLEIADGFTAGINPRINLYKLDLDFFQYSDSARFEVSDGVMSSNEGLKGPTAENRVLIAQLTTDGKLSFNINLQLISPFGEIEQYVAVNPVGKEILFEGLNYRQYKK